MKKYILVLIAILVFCINQSMAQYYYSDNRQIPLNVDSTKVTIWFDNTFSLDYIDDFVEYYDRIDSMVTGEYSHDNYEVFAINNGNNLNEFIDSLYLDQRINKVNNYFLVGPETPFLVGNTICCKFNDSMSYSSIDSINQLYGIEIVREKTVQPKEFLLSITNTSPYNTLEIANIYYELDCVEYSHPNFYGGIEFHNYEMYDHYWDQQWAMHRIFGITGDSTTHKAFDITTGDTGIIVAVIDAGIGSHEDFDPANVVGGYDFINDHYNQNPCSEPGSNTAHGISVAGIIFGQHNRDPQLQIDRSTGIYGIAPECKLMPLKITSGYPYYDDDSDCYPKDASIAGVAAAIDHAYQYGADILSCSWGYRYAMLDDLTLAVIRAATYGRDGKGCALFFSSGNDGLEYGEDNIVWPQMMDQVITVGATDTMDCIRNYSNWGKIDVVAPSGDDYKTNYEEGIWTTDLPGDMGYVYYGGSLACNEPLDRDYMCVFSGTSAAQPVAAGVAALVLSVKPDLTRHQLHSIVKHSADPDLSETIVGPPHEKYGHGLVHPLRALLSVCRGDADNNRTLNLLDINHIIAFLYDEGPEPIPHPLMGDADGDGIVNLLDVIYLIKHIYDNPPGPEPPISFEYGDYEF